MAGRMSDKLNDAGKDEVALMIALWHDFKCQGKFDAAISINALKFAKTFGVSDQYTKLQLALPPMKIEPAEEFRKKLFT